MEDDGGQRRQRIQLFEAVPQTLLELGRVLLDAGIVTVAALQARRDELLQGALAGREGHLPGADINVIELGALFALLLRDVTGEEEEEGNRTFRAEDGDCAANTDRLPLDDDDAADRLAAPPDDS